MTAIKHTGGGRYDPDEDRVFFIAGNNIRNVPRYHPWTLLALDTVLNESGMSELRERLERPDSKLFLDSGVFWLSTTYAKKNGLTFNEALRLPPEQVTGFDRLYERYLELVKELEPDLWGYVELDQGGVEGKRRIRAELEAEGLRPIPVYHPLSDGWDYLDELLDAGYDRIAVGNVVMADAATRRAICTTIWERRRRVKHKVWIHILGYTPNPLFNAIPCNSSDSSSHIYALRFGASMCMGRVMLAQFGELQDVGYSYDLEMYKDEERGLPKKTALLGWIARSEVIGWRSQQADLMRVLPGYEPWPEPFPGEILPAPAVTT